MSLTKGLSNLPSLCELLREAAPLHRQLKDRTAFLPTLLVWSSISKITKRHKTKPPVPCPLSVARDETTAAYSLMSAALNANDAAYTKMFAAKMSV